MRDLPPGWAWATLPELITTDGVFSDGDWVETKDQDPLGHVRLTQLADIGEGSWKDKSQRFMTHDAADRLGCTYLRQSDVLIARMPDPLGRACLFPGDEKPCVTAVDVCIVRPGERSVDPRWLMWWFNTPQVRADVLSRQSGTTRKRISRKNLAAIAMPLPTLAEQRRIVTVIEERLSRLDAAAAAARSAQARMSAARSSILLAAFADFAEAKPLIELTDLERPICYGILKPRTLGDLVVPYVEVRSIRAGRIDVGALHRTTLELHREFSRSTLKTGDVVVAIRGSWDRAAVVPSELDGANVSRDVARIAPNARLDPRFLAYFLASPSAGRYFGGVARGVGVRGVNIGDLRSLPVPCPPLEAQASTVERIEAALSSLAAAASTVTLTLRRAEALRRAILARAFRGELVAQDPTDEPASELLERIAAECAAAPKPTRRRKAKTPA